VQAPLHLETWFRSYYRKPKAPTITSGDSNFSSLNTDDGFRPILLLPLFCPVQRRGSDEHNGLGSMLQHAEPTSEWKINHPAVLPIGNREGCGAMWFMSRIRTVFHMRVRSGAACDRQYSPRYPTTQIPKIIEHKFASHPPQPFRFPHLNGPTDSGQHPQNMTPNKRPRKGHANPPTVAPIPKSQKPPGELLTSEEKRANHIASVCCPLFPSHPKPWRLMCC